MKYLIFSLCISAILWSCKDAAKENIIQLHDQVIQVHDSAMVKMTDIHRIKKDLATYLQASADTVAVMTAIRALDDADESMMVWMQEFNASYDTLPSIEQKKYLEEELDKINLVSKIMFSSIEAGEKLIKK